MKVYFIGAGATAGTLPLGPNAQQTAPVAVRFGETLANMPDWERAFPALSDVVQHLGIPIHNVKLETLWACIDYYAKLARALPSPAAWRGESHQLKKLLLRLYVTGNLAAYLSTPGECARPSGVGWRRRVASTAAA